MISFRIYKQSVDILLIYNKYPQNQVDIKKSTRGITLVKPKPGIQIPKITQPEQASPVELYLGTAQSQLVVLFIAVCKIPKS